MVQRLLKDVACLRLGAIIIIIIIIIIVVVVFVVVVVVVIYLFNVGNKSMCSKYIVNNSFPRKDKMLTKQTDQ